MNQILFSLSMLSFFLVAPFSNWVLAEQNCTSKSEAVELEGVEATAALWANYRNKEGSLRFESEKLLTKALTELEKVKAQAPNCSGECSTSRGEITFSSVPKKFLVSYSDKDKCERKLRETSETPIRYTNRIFNSISELNDWFSEFSQGKGKDGSDLYEKCDGDCSPRYTLSILAKETKYSVDASVLCGSARDKDDNNYLLKASARWVCSK